MKIAIIVPMAEEAEFYRNHFHSENKEMFGSTEFEHFSVNGNDDMTIIDEGDMPF